ncbi:hypothetical protein AsAng_0022240 [Aureispira anguillae]|uniref:Uncharacterized protein n=1 Tax=Aureispira anguillae TaxID=2864201 RepID=A0A915YE88_9BACT|nr:hypothetical protein AsAng_0022240 [Aureispira anguillae]
MLVEFMAKGFAVVQRKLSVMIYFSFKNNSAFDPDFHKIQAIKHNLK